MSYPIIDPKAIKVTGYAADCWYCKDHTVHMLAREYPQITWECNLCGATTVPHANHEFEYYFQH